MISANERADMEKQFLTSDRLYLRALADTDLEGPYVEWLNDAEVCRHNSHHVFQSVIRGTFLLVVVILQAKIAGTGRGDLPA